MNAGFQIATAALLSPGSGCGRLQFFCYSYLAISWQWLWQATD